VPIRRHKKNNTEDITALTRSGTTASVTTASTAPTVGNKILVRGVGTSNYNGEFTVTGSSGNTATYTMDITGDPTTAPVITGSTISTVLGVAGSMWLEHDSSATLPRAEGDITVVADAGTRFPKSKYFTRSVSGQTLKYAPTLVQTVPASGTLTFRVKAIESSGGTIGNLVEGTTLTPPNGLLKTDGTPATVTSATVAAGGLTGGGNSFAGDLVSWTRWINVLKNYSRVSGATGAEDAANNPVLFARPVP
jgi:hypothetical protein